MVTPYMRLLAVEGAGNVVVVVATGIVVVVVVVVDDALVTALAIFVYDE